MSYSITPEVVALRSYHYNNRRAKETLRLMNSETGIIVEPSIKRALERQGFTFDDLSDNKSNYRPQTCFDNLHKYAEPLSARFDDAAWNAAYKSTLKAFSLNRKLKQECDPRLIMSFVKGEKASGAPEFQHKADTMTRDYGRMERWLAGQKCPDPCVAQHRVQHGNDGQSKNRLVWAYPSSVTMAESMFARPLIDAYIPVRSPMAMGKHRYKLSAMMTPMMNAHAKYGLDMSRFDASVSPNLICMAFNVLSHNFDWSQSNRDDWNKILDYFINTPILMPDGWVYIKHRGVPSGSYFTQLVDSVVNYFIIQYAYFTITGKTIYQDRILVLGDDSLFSSNLAISLKEFANVLSIIGFKMNPDKSCLILDDGNIEFLGHEWVKGLVDRDPKEIAKRMVYPERHSQEKDARKRIRSRIYPYICDAISAHKIISEYQKVRTNDIIARYNQVDVNMRDSQIGWKEHLDTISKEPEINRNMLIQAYVGILR